ncbi:MAG: ROK family protein, partial [Candidatus Binatia bacterium]
IGGTKIRAVLWNGKRVVQAREFPTPKNKTNFKKSIVAVTFRLSRQKPISKIGVGAAGIVERSTLIFSPNIPYIQNFNFRSLWPSTPSLRVDNDARCFARAEFLGGAGRRSKRLFALTIGTGIGRSYGKNGKIIKIKKFEYPERWEREYQRIRNTEDNRKLANFLGQKLAALLKPFKPEAIVIGGGVMDRSGFPQRLQEAMKAHGLACKIRRARLGKNAVAVGAALLFNEYK